MFIIYSSIPENLMPVFFDIGHLMKWDVQSLTHSVGVLAVPLSSASPSLIQGVPVPHKNSCHTVALAWNTSLFYLYITDIFQVCLLCFCHICLTSSLKQQRRDRAVNTARHGANDMSYKTHAFKLYAF